MFLHPVTSGSTARQHPALSCLSCSCKQIPFYLVGCSKTMLQLKGMVLYLCFWLMIVCEPDGKLTFLFLDQRGHLACHVQMPAHMREWNCTSGMTGRAGKPFLLVAIHLNCLLWFWVGFVCLFVCLGFFSTEHYCASVACDCPAQNFSS